MYVTVEWIKGARKVVVPTNINYACTVYIEVIDLTLSIIVKFIDSVNEGYLSFLRPELVQDIDFRHASLNLLEGDRVVAIATFN